MFRPSLGCSLSIVWISILDKNKQNLGQPSASFIIVITVIIVIPAFINVCGYVPKIRVHVFLVFLRNSRNLVKCNACLERSVPYVGKIKMT